MLKDCSPIHCLPTSVLALCVGGQASGDSGEEGGWLCLGGQRCLKLISDHLAEPQKSSPERTSDLLGLVGLQEDPGPFSPPLGEQGWRLGRSELL